MTRRRTNKLIVDGEPYNWRASRRAIMVEHAEEQRGRVCEFLTAPEKVGAGRIVHLVRHAVSRGWKMSLDDDVFEIETSTVWDDPRVRDHYLWMRLMLPQFRNLEAFLGSPIELGAYWWHGNLSTPLGGFGARIRFAHYASMPEADLWEAAFCMTGTEGDQAYSDIFAFPFKGGRNLALEDKRIRTFWLKQDCERTEGVWRDSGWQDWDRADQWAHVTQPGHVFSALKPSENDIEAPHGAALPIRFQLAKPAEETITYALHHVREATRGELLPVMNGERWFSWDECPVSELDRTATWTLVEGDISKLGEVEDWEPGEYHVVLRIRRDRKDDQGQSDISEPIRVVIT